MSFFVASAIVLGAALAVVRAQNLVRGVLWLGVVLAGTAALYAMLDASFLAAAQVLVYVGGVVTLMIFGVMLTRRHDGLGASSEGAGPSRGVFGAALLFAALAVAVTTSKLPSETAPTVTTAELARGMLTTHLVAFEALSLLLLAAIIGAIVIARRRDHGQPARPVAAPPAPRPLARETDLHDPEATP